MLKAVLVLQPLGATHLTAFLKNSLSDTVGLRWNTSGCRVLSQSAALNLTADRMKLAALNA